MARLIAAILAGLGATLAVWWTAYPTIRPLVENIVRRVTGRPISLYPLTSTGIVIGILTLPGIVLAAVLARGRSGDRETRCRQCGYILRGITEPRCPECGQAI